MFVVGNNLRELVQKHNIVENVNDVDETCIELRLHKVIRRFHITNTIDTLKYGDPIPKEIGIKETVGNEGLTLKPNETVLACSKQQIFLPQGFMGMVQTKGSLARMFVFAQCSDSQIDSGFRGRVTFELFNASPFNIIINKGQKIANLYIMMGSDKNVKKYQGKYNLADEPTLQKP
jgi:hypothetical protein